MAKADTRTKTVVSCVACGAVLGAAVTADGSYVPLGSSDACACGNASEFQRLR